MTNVLSVEFPFAEIRTAHGDYFPTVESAEAAGFTRDQIWSVCECDGVFCYGPSHHYVNVLGFIATAEKHDGNTYYEEPEDGDDDDELAD